MPETTLLLCEDNPDDVEFFLWALAKAKISLPVQVVKHGWAAVDYLQGNGDYDDRERYALPSLVFLDLKMPYMTGMQVLEWIRGQELFRNLPVAILSGSDEQRDRKGAERLGACDYIVKPAEPQHLQTLLASFGLI